MHLFATSVLAPTAIALVAGAWLGYAVITSHRPGRVRLMVAGLLAVALVPWVAVIGLTAAGVVGGSSQIAVFAAWDTRGLRERCQAAQSLGASDWRIFCRVFLPERVVLLVAGVVLAWMRLLLQRGSNGAI